MVELLYFKTHTHTSYIQTPTSHTHTHTDTHTRSSPACCLCQTFTADNINVLILFLHISPSVVSPLHNLCCFRLWKVPLPICLILLTDTIINITKTSIERALRAVFSIKFSWSKQTLGLNGKFFRIMSESEAYARRWTDSFIGLSGSVFHGSIEQCY